MKSRLQAFAMAVVVCGSGCNLPDPHAQQASAYSGPVAAPVIRAEVPEGFGGLPSLGVPLDGKFETLIGGGGSLFPESGPPVFQGRSEFSSERDIVRTDQELRANAHAWGIGASVSMSKQDSFAYYRAFQIVGVWQLDESTHMSRPPPDARYYASQIVIGHSYSLLIRGESSRVSTALSANFGPYGGSVSGFESKFHVNATSVGHGLSPIRPDAIFAPAELVSAYYAPDQNHPPDAIIIHYREIPPVVTVNR